MIPTRNSDGTKSESVGWGERVRSNDQHFATFYFCLASQYLDILSSCPAVQGYWRILPATQPSTFLGLNHSLNILHASSHPLT